MFRSVKVTENTEKERNSCLSLCEEKRKEKNRATREGIRREMSKCLFMPNWATDEPAAISDNSLSRRKEERCMKGGAIGDRE